MCKIPTVEEFATSNGLYVSGEPVMSLEDVIFFTKLHVKAALEAAARDARLSLNGSDVPYVEHYEKADRVWTVNEKTILQSYPEEKIK